VTEWAVLIGNFQFVCVAIMHENGAVRKAIISTFQPPGHCLALEMEQR